MLNLLFSECIAHTEDGEWSDSDMEPAKLVLKYIFCLPSHILLENAKECNDLSATRNPFVEGS